MEAIAFGKMINPATGKNSILTPKTRVQYKSIAFQRTPITARNFNLNNSI